mmetsp:Transcript_27299/g.109356  ORF Transcript_27299/g.109356 Transcript_27299/m.109356 type:complete len:174 (+) Transcript_27299:446-967(+)
MLVNERARDRARARGRVDRAPIRFDPDVRDFVLPVFSALMQHVEPDLPCRSAPDFAAAVVRLITTRELELLRREALGSPVPQPERGPTRELRHGPLVLQLATSLPDSARVWWYSKEALAHEILRRRAEGATADDVAVLYVPGAYGFLQRHHMPRCLCPLMSRPICSPPDTAVW